jgi:hypothetical protein
MTAPHAEDLIDEYFTRLEDETVNLPQEVRWDLIESIEDHIADARGELAHETDADVLNLLERLGDPSDLAREAWERSGMPLPRPFKIGVLEIAAIVLLPFVWPIGVLLLWSSAGWTWWDKLLASVLPPGGYWLVFIVGAGSRTVSCSGSHELSNGHVVTYTCPSSATGWHHGLVVTGFLVLLALPILTSIYLAVRLRVREARQAVVLAPQA